MTLTRPDGARAPSLIRLSAKQVLAPIAMIIVAAGLLAFAANRGGTLGDPVGHRVYEVGIIVTAVAILAFGIWQSVQAGRLSALFLMSFAAGTAFGKRRTAIGAPTCSTASGSHTTTGATRYGHRR